MDEYKLGVVETQFAELVWENAPIASGELVKLCAQSLEWKKSTTYTVLKKLCEKGIFAMENSTVTVCIEKDAFHAMQSEKFVEETFRGSLPAFIAAFSSRKKPTPAELEEIRALLDKFGEG